MASMLKVVGILFVLFGGPIRGASAALQSPQDHAQDAAAAYRRKSDVVTPSSPQAAMLSLLERSLAGRASHKQANAQRRRVGQSRVQHGDEFSRSLQVVDGCSTQYIPGSVELAWFQPFVNRTHTQTAVNGSICTRATHAKQLCGVRSWLEYAAISRQSTAPYELVSMATNTKPSYRTLVPTKPNGYASQQLSRFVRRAADGSEVHEWIEPLTAMARHPLASELCGDFLGGKTLSTFLSETASKVAPSCRRGISNGLSPDFNHTHMFDITYLIPANGCDANGRPAADTKPGVSCGSGIAEDRTKAQRAPRNYYFDLGCTVYDDNQTLNSAADSGSGIGPSLPLFFQMYERRCIVFDHLHGWEVRQGRPYNKWAWAKQVPHAMRPRVHYYHTGVNETGADGGETSAWRKAVHNPMPATGQARGRRPPGLFSKAPSPASFLKTLVETVTPQDFVVVKVDIDGGPELPIVRAIADHPELAQLVDELYFECHFYFDGNAFGWQYAEPRMTSGDATGLPTADLALDLMQRLRRQGVRSHFWI